MKKNLLSIVLVIVMIAAMMVSFTACGEKAEDENVLRIAELEQQNAALQNQVEALTAELDNMKQKAALQSWNLSAEAWPDGNGATVTFSAMPVNYVTGQSIALSVRMGDLEAESTACVWDGTAYTGSVELNAADGYSYYCILTSPDGTQEEIAMDTPENVKNDSLVYLGTSLSSYANLIVDDWSNTANSLTVKSGFARYQSPRLSSNGSAVSLTKAELVFQLNGETLERKEISMPAGEADGSYEVALSETSFSLPKLEDDYQLDLLLEVTLSNGTTASVCGGSWYYNGGELILVVG